MFKRLRERIAEEATKFPVGQLGNNSGKLFPEPENKSAETNSTEDLITLSDSSSVVVPHTSPQQFSIGEEEDGSLSEQSTPQKKQNASSGGSDAHYNSGSSGITDFSFGQEYRPSKKLSYVPQSDIESEREDPPTLNLDGISKDQLMAAIQSLKAKSYKYKNKYAEVVKNYKELREEKIKIETTLIENQDKGLRRIAELREQCQLEQKAKAHLEENLRLLLEEKDSRICVLETQINLLKEGGKSNSTKSVPDDCDSHYSDGGSGDTRSEDSATSMSNDISALQEKVERLQHQINQDKKTITAQKDQISLLRKQNENLSQELEEKMKKLNSLEDEESKIKTEHENVLKNMQDRLKELEKQQEESVMSMAETKRNMHEELELKEKQLVKAEEESKQYQAVAEREKELHSELKVQHEEKVNELLRQLELTEKTLEEEKQSLLHELAQGKTAAINLMQQECARKVTAIEEEWKAKCEALQSSCGKASQSKIDELSSSLTNVTENLKRKEQRVKELDSQVSELEKENASLKNSVEKLESEIAQSSANYEKLKVSYSDYESLKEKESLLKTQEALNVELNEKIAKYMSAKQELQSQHDVLCDQLKEKNIFIANIENERNDLTEKIKSCEASQSELETACINLKNEIIALNESLRKEINKVENLTLENASKLEEIDQLHEQLKKVKINEKLVLEKLNMSLGETREFESENADLLLNNRLLSEEIERLKHLLHNKDKELRSLTESFSKSAKEISMLQEAVEVKEIMIKQAVIGYKQVESLATSLEQQQTYLKSTLENFEIICQSAFEKSSYISNIFELMDRSCLETKMIYKHFDKLSDNSGTVIGVANSGGVGNIESNSIKSKAKNDKSQLSINCETSQSLSSENASKIVMCSESEGNTESLDVQGLLEIIDRLKSENVNLRDELCSCRTSAELQDVEFAKNITILQQSLSDLQEERNNLSLVLQNIESTQTGNSYSQIQSEIQTKENEEYNEANYQYNWERRIAHLNAKVKSEIEALSSQTEVVNKELKCLREQFISNQDSCSEKVTQLNVKLLYRTEALINLKEDLDSSIQYANCLKEELQKAQSELCEKSKLLTELENNKNELESKCKNLKQEYFKKECTLKETHNCQLAELKTHTELTIEKMNEQIKQLNKQLEEKDTELKLRFSNTEHEYQQQISDLKSQVDNVLNCQTEINKFSDIHNSFESKIFNSMSKLDLYCSKIVILSSKISCFVSKLNEKDQKILQQSSTILDLQEQLENYDELRNNFNNLQNELDSTSKLLENANKMLEVEKSNLKSSEAECSAVKTDYENALKEIKNLSSTNASEKSKLQSLLDAATRELEFLKLKQCESLSILSSKDTQLQELQEKYSSSASEKSKLQSLLDVATQELESLKLKQCESSSILSSKDTRLQELQEKYLSSVSEIDTLTKLLNEHKSQSEQQTVVVTELSNSYHSIVSLINDLSAQLKEHEVKASVLLDKKETQLKSIESKFLTILSGYQLKVEEISDFKTKISSCLKELENTKDFLEKEKEKLKISDVAIHEWKSKYEKSVHDINKLTSSSKESNQKLDETEAQLNDINSKLANATEEIEKLSLQNKKISEMNNKLKKHEVDFQSCQKQLNEITEKITVVDNEKSQWKLKYEKSVHEIDVLLGSNKDCNRLLEEREIQLNDVKSKLNSTEEEIKNLKLQIESTSMMQDKLNKTELDFKNSQKLLNEQIEKGTTIEKEKNDWKLKYETVSQDLQKASQATLKYKENIQKLMSELKAKNAKIKLMITVDKLEEVKENHKLEIQKFENQIENLQLEMKSLSQSLLEKENAIRSKESEKENLEAHHEESLKCMKDKLQNAEKNYKTQIEEMKLRINQLEKEKSILLSEKENLLIIQNQFKELKSGEEKVQSELKSKEQQLKALEEKLETSNKEQVEKIHTFQENMKDKENMIVKLKANLESVSKEHKEIVEELHKKIKHLEVEREQLMLQAQERVSATEAKCREDIKFLQEKHDKLLLENKEIENLKSQVAVLSSQLEESLLVSESNQASANKEISLLKDQLTNSEKKLADAEKIRLISESELTNKLEKLQQENKLLLHNSDHVEKLKAEKEELNEKLKTAVQQVNKINVLQTERDHLKKENEELLKEIKHIRTAQNESASIKEKLELLEENKSVLNKQIEKLNSENENLKTELLSLKNSFKTEKETFLSEKDKLLNQIQQLENCVSDPQNTPVKNYVESLKKEYEMAIKAKDDDTLAKLKQLVRDFSIQMDVKDKDSEQMINELLEKNQFLEEKLQKEHTLEIAALRQDLIEKDCALAEMRDNYIEEIQEKDAKIKEQEMMLKSLSSKDNYAASDSVHGTSEHSDWDDSWVVPDEVAENSSPSQNTKPCEEHEKQIESLQEELSKCNSEIKELKVLLRLSPPETMVNNNNRRDSMQSLPEPTEFEYLKNIIYEYMMGKEPVTLAKVIAAVLRFSDSQTQQVIRREEAKHPTR